MSDQNYDVVIAAYATIDAAKKDFDALVQHVQSEHIKTTEGVILVEHDYGGDVHVTDSADHHGRKGMAWGGGVGLLVGLFAPPLLASVVVAGAAGGLVGKFVKHRIDSGLEDKMGQTLPEGKAGIITLVAHTDTPGVKEALPGVFMCSVAPVDGDGVKALKQGLIEASKPGGGSAS